MVSDGCVLLQDEHLDRLADRLGEMSRDLHVYVIGSRPRIAFVPEEWTFRENSYRAVFRIHRQGVYEDFSIDCTYPPHAARRFTRIESPWPHTTGSLYAKGDRVTTAKAALPIRNNPVFYEYRDLEVLYVGQSYGECGERNAQDRLQSHSTLQKTLSEASRLNPDREVWLSLFNFEQYLITSGDGSFGSTPVDAKDDDNRIDRMFDNLTPIQPNVSRQLPRSVAQNLPRMLRPGPQYDFC